MLLSNVNLAQYSNYKIGGPAKFFYEAKTISKLREALLKAREQNLPLFILGGGTNVLFGEGGFDGLVIKPSLSFIKKVSQNEIQVGAGTSIDELNDYATEEGLSGLEWSGGLPGTLGGAIRGNAGCFGGEIKDVVRGVSALELRTANLEHRTLTNAECKFGYRTSVFSARGGSAFGGKKLTSGLRKSVGLTKSKHWAPEFQTNIILEATIALKKGDKKKIKKAVQEKINYRDLRYPMEYPNIGSIFKNIPVSSLKQSRIRAFKHVIKSDPFPVIPTAYLISEAGLKGVSFGGAMISPKHPNFIVNIEYATSEHVQNLMRLVKNTIKEKFDIDLEEEVIIQQ